MQQTGQDSDDKDLLFPLPLLFLRFHYERLEKVPLSTQHTFDHISLRIGCLLDLDSCPIASVVLFNDTFQLRRQIWRVAGNILSYK
jgi:hypothetical protein